ncbi:hypothetical protein [Eubacterium aggregans]|uniref:hypothetical protein n=1 Tax=Eubacterium aggregans TaxID=81409 RepID=UPI003F315ECC
MDKYYEAGSGLSYDWITDYHGSNFNDFEAYVMSQPAPTNILVQFSTTSGSARWDFANKVQVTDYIQVTGYDGGMLSFTVPNGVTLIKGDGTRLTGAVTLNVGDSFHLEAPAKACDGTWSTGPVGESHAYQGLILKFG